MCFRSSVSRVVLAFMVTTSVEAEEILDIDGAIRRGLASGEIAAESQKVEEAHGRLRQSTARPNPSLVYDRQNIGDEGIAPGFIQDLVKVEQTFLDGRRRRARQTLGRRGVEQASWEVAASRRRKIWNIRQAFVRALEAQEIAEAHRSILGRVREIQRIIEERVTAGESSLYEKARVGLALTQSEDEIASAGQDQARARTELASAMSSRLPDEVTLQGSLLPGALSPAAKELMQNDADGALAVPSKDVTDITTATGLRPEMGVEISRMRTARAEEAVARSERFAQVTAGLGYMAFEQTALPVQNGYNAVVAVSLPVWDQKQGDIQAARARARSAERSLEALTARLQAEAQGYREQAHMATSRLAKLEQTSRTQLGPLIEMAQSSYQAGTQTLLELLDAYRLERDFKIQRIRARSALRQALENLAFGVLEDPLSFLETAFMVSRKETK